MTMMKAPCRLCRREWDEWVDWHDEYCRECFKQLQGFSAAQEDVIQKLMLRIEALEKVKATS